MKYKFWRKGAGETLETAEEFESKLYDGDDLDLLAEVYAEHFYDNCDGWDCEWPIRFTIADETGKELGTVEVEMEARPNFYGLVL